MSSSPDFEFGITSLMSRNARNRKNNKYHNCAKKTKNKTKMTIIAKRTKITNQGSDTGKYNKSLKERRKRGFINVTKIPKITIIAKITRIKDNCVSRLLDLILSLNSLFSLCL